MERIGAASALMVLAAHVIQKREVASCGGGVELSGMLRIRLHFTGLSTLFYQRWCLAAYLRFSSAKARIAVSWQVLLCQGNGRVGHGFVELHYEFRPQ